MQHWGHNQVLLTKLMREVQRLAYSQAALTHSWTRNALVLPRKFAMQGTVSHIGTGLGKKPIKSRGAGRQYAGANVFRMLQVPVLLESGHERGQQSMQPFGAEAIRRLPEQ